MKFRAFFKSFAGAFIGILVYESFFNDLSDPFENYWADYFVEILGVAICVFCGIYLVNFIMEKFVLFQPDENA